MPPPPRSGAGGSANPATRQNEYFVPRDGIDREVISADICRYLGNDALVRPGHYDNPQTGQTIQGYYITAYRNLTSAMIEDLKADSARWDAERRAQTSRTTPNNGSNWRDPNGTSSAAPRPPPDSHGTQYRQSETYNARQYHGPSDGSNYQQDSYRDSNDGHRYPGSGSQGYNGATPSYPSQQQNFAPQGGQGGGGYGYQQQGYHPQSPQAQEPKYNSHPPGPMSNQMNQGYQPSPDSSYVATGANRFAGANEPHGANRMGGPPGPTGYPTQAPPPHGFAQPARPSYPYPGQPPPPNGDHQYPGMQQHNDYYGRASPASQSNRPPSQQQPPPPPPPPAFASGQGQQFDDGGRSRKSTTPSNPPHIPSSTMRNDHDGDRQMTDRPSQPPPSRR